MAMRFGSMDRYATEASSVTVIGSQFCVPNQSDILVSKKANSLRSGNFVITDVHDKIIFKVKPNKFFAFHNQRLLLDASDNPIVTLRRKLWSKDCRWQVFLGKSKGETDMVFSVKIPTLQYPRTTLNVYLATNTSENSCDFKIKGTWYNRTSTIFIGDSPTIIAKMHMKKTEGSNMILGKNKFMVTISPNVDYAFIVSLIAILGGASKDMSTPAGVGIGPHTLNVYIPENMSEYS